MVLADCITHGRAWRDGVLLDDDVTAEEIGAIARDDGVIVWVDLMSPSAEALADLSDRLGLAPTTIEDAVAPHERPKVTRHGGSLFFTVYAVDLAEHAASPSRGRVHTSRLSGIVLPHALITIRLDDGIDLAPVLAAWDDNPDLVRTGVGGLLHGLLDTVVDGHFDAIQRLDDELEGLEDELFAEETTNRRFVQRVYGFRKDLVALRRVVLPMREVVNALLRHRDSTPEVPGSRELDHWYDDLYDHVLRAAEWTESLRDMVTTVFETNLSLQDSRLNVVMKKLAGWAAIIAIPTAITGWFGQNVPYWGFAKPLGLWLSLGLIITVSGALYLTFRRRDWL